METAYCTKSFLILVNACILQVRHWNEYQLEVKG
jgi:hypothetical protein